MLRVQEREGTIKYEKVVWDSNTASFNQVINNSECKGTFALD